MLLSFAYSHRVPIVEYQMELTPIWKPSVGLVEASTLLTEARGNVVQVLRDAAAIYRVDRDAITLKVKQEFAAKEKKRAAKPKPPLKKKAA